MNQTKMIKCIKICFFLIFSSFLFAQETLKSADDYFRKNDFERALQYLQIMLNNPEQLKGDELPFAYLLRAKTYINLLDQAVKNKDNKEIEKYKDAYFLAFQDLNDARKQNKGEAAEKETEALAEYLHTILRGLGANFLNNIYSTENINTDTRKILLDEAQKYLMATLNLKEDDYLAQDFYAQVMMLKRADDLAMEHFAKSQKYYRIDNNFPDFEHFRVYGNMAILYMKNKDSNKAIATIDEGLKNLEKLYLESQPVPENLIGNYKTMKSDLEGIEMDIYLNVPEKMEEALKKFKKRSEEKPKDFALRLAYAQLLEQHADFNGAMVQYKAALEINSSNNLAWYNMGALQLNEALNLPKNSSDDIEIQRKALLQNASIAFKKALELNKDDLMTIDALMKVYLNLQDLETYQYYRKLKAEKLKGK
jgi:hypothetical protein